MDGLECSEISFLNAITSSYSSRLDSDFFKKDALEFSVISENWDVLSAICPEIKSGTTPAIRDKNLKDGIALLKTNDIRNNIISPLSAEQFFYIDEQTDKKMKSSSVKDKDVLINIVGASTDVIGRVAFVPEGFIKSNITQAMAILRIENTEYLPEYLFAFLLGDYAKRQTNRIARQTGQYNMNLTEIGTYRIWKPSMAFQLTIAKIIQAVNAYQIEGQKLYQEGQNIASGLLSIHDDIFNQISSIKAFSETLSSVGRLDAEYYQPKYDYYLEMLSHFETTRIPAEFDIYKNSGTNYAEGISDIGVIKTKQLANSGIDTDGVESYFTNETCAQNKSTFISNNDVVFASMGVGSLGKVSLFSYEGEERFVTDSTLRIYRAKETTRILPEVLCVFLQSTIGQELIYRYVVGSTGIINIYDEDIAKIPIPVLDMEIQKNIAEKVQESFVLRRHSKQLLEYAKQAVDMAVEQGEDVALAWLKDKVE